MVLKKVLFIGPISLFFACQNQASAPVKATQNPAEQAANLYAMHCAQCHGDDGKLGASGAKDLSLTSLSDNEIHARIVKGKNAMPPMGALLENEANIQLVMSHLKTLKH
jgi:cytochrome c6